LKHLKQNKTKLFIISGPGGVGKTTLVEKALRKRSLAKKFIRNISCTTRQIRPGEKNGKDYFFLSEEEFLKNLRSGFFLEHQKVAGNYYGTPRFLYEKAKKLNKNLLLCIDVKGGMFLKKHFKDGPIASIFVTAPRNELLSRLKNRAEKPEVIKKRMALAKKEMAYQKHYHRVLINANFKKALKELERILLEKI
jgi:guanylate kinase